MKTARSFPGKQLPKDFDGLVRLHMPRAISTEATYEKTQEMIDRLTSIPKLTAGQKIYLKTLSILFEAYERKHERWSQTDRFPGIDFRSTPTGRAAFVTGTGLAVWELAAIWQDHGRSAAKVRKNYPHLTGAQIAAAVRYARARADEIKAESKHSQASDPVRGYPILTRVKV